MLSLICVDKFRYCHELRSEVVQSDIGVAMVANQSLVESGQGGQSGGHGVNLASTTYHFLLDSGLTLKEVGLFLFALCNIRDGRLDLFSDI